MSARSKHSAAPNLAGYIWQVRRALITLFTLDDGQYIELESLDDVVIRHTNHNFAAALQTKHSLEDEALSHRSVEWWKTLRVWCSIVDQFTPTSRLYLAATSQLANSSILEPLKQVPAKKNTPPVPTPSQIEGIRGELNRTARARQNRELEPAYAAWLGLRKSQQSDVLGRISIFDSQPKLAKTDDSILKNVQRYAALPEYRLVVFKDRLLGWFDTVVAERLSNTVCQVSHEEFRRELAHIRDDLSTRTLHSVATRVAVPTLSEEQKREPHYLRQLSIINANDDELRHAIEMLYRAEAERHAWLQAQLTGEVQLSAYDADLVNAWRKIRLKHLRRSTTDQQGKVDQGWGIHDDCMDYKGSLAGSQPDIHVSSGTYYKLSDAPADKVPQLGWHPEFESLLTSKEKDGK